VTYASYTACAFKWTPAGPLASVFDDRRDREAPAARTLNPHLHKPVGLVCSQPPPCPDLLGLEGVCELVPGPWLCTARCWPCW
jgi:hypothetical protein